MSEKCRLCLKLIPIESVIKLYYFLPETIETAEIVRHIAKYLHIQVKKDDIVSTIICQDCNDHLEDFHKFSENISAKQVTLQNELLEVDLKTESPHCDDNTDEKMNSTCLIKDEVVENKISVADEAMLEYPIDVVKNELNSDKEDDDFGEQDMLTGDICENDASEEYEEYKLQDDIQSSNDETIPERGSFFNDYGMMNEEDWYDEGPSVYYVTEIDEQAEADAESKAEELNIVTTAGRESREIDQGIKGLTSDVTNNEETPTRKRKGDKHAWMQNIRKTKRQSGKAYVTKSGKLIKERQPQPIHCKCRHKCIEQIKNAERIAINAEFWKLSDYAKQQLYLRQCIQFKKCQRGPVGGSRRDKTLVYTLRSKQVCKQFFLKTLNISDGAVSVFIKKSECQEVIDKRGQHDHHRKKRS